MQVRAVLWICLLALLLSGCGKKTRVVAPTRGQVQAGLATWYGKDDGYHGKRTASGEKFDRNKLTAAHYDLPFGTRVKVRNQKNGKEVTVRINDRIPIETVRKGRIIDLSYKAAKVLGMLQDGIAPVVVEILEMPANGLLTREPLERLAGLRISVMRYSARAG